MFRTWHADSQNTTQSTLRYDKFLDLDSSTPRSSNTFGSGNLSHTLQPPMNNSHFYDDSSEDEMPAWDDCSDVSFNPWANSKRSSSLLEERDNRSSLTSFRFAAQTQSDAAMNRTTSSFSIKSAPKSPTASPRPTDRKKSSKKARPESTQNAQPLASINGVQGDLQRYAQTLLQGEIAEGIPQEMDLYQECFPRRHSTQTTHSQHFLSPKRIPPSRERAAHDKDYKRVSMMSIASDASAVPSLVFSDADGQNRRQSTTLSFTAQVPNPKALHRNSLISLDSINTIASDKSWFMDDESPLQSPIEPLDPEPLGKRVSFIRDVELGLSCFDDGDDDEEEESYLGDLKEFKFPGRSGMEIKTAPINRKKPSPIKTMASPHRASLSPRNSQICASPNPRRSRRRTASSECIVLEALEKMNAVMYDFANEDINRKSVVGLDLPGNQVSVEAYGELWW